jgi:GNAT superfamily N-acetyltransferase
MRIVDFGIEHIEAAKQIARQNYEAERSFVDALPPVEEFPDLRYFAENNLGVAAFEGDEMVGFLCAVSPFGNAFGSTDAVGVFSPMHANGTIPKNRAQIYARMYQAAGEKWAKAGAASHAICLYAHDKAGQEQFFRYGFGLRCIDAIRGMDEIETQPCHGFEFAELAPEEYISVLPLDHMLDAHMTASPTFILRQSQTEASFIDMAATEHSRYFAVKEQDRIIAFMKVQSDGETFICETPGYIHINGAYCLSAYRGKNLYQYLFNFVVRTLKGEGYTRLGVDFESINPAAYGFWLKYFTAYTHSVTRRIDEHAIANR